MLIFESSISPLPNSHYRDASSTLSSHLQRRANDVISLHDSAIFLNGAILIKLQLEE